MTKGLQLRGVHGKNYANPPSLSETPVAASGKMRVRHYRERRAAEYK